MAILLIAITAISTISAGRLKVERDAVLKNLRRAEIAEADSRTNSSTALKSQAQAGRFSGRIGQRFESSTRWPRRRRSGELGYASERLLRSATRRSPAWHSPI